MQKAFSKRLRSGLLAGLGVSFPAYREKSIYVFPGDMVFVVHTDDVAVSGYFVICPDHHGRNRFTVDVCWSTHARFPQLPRRPYGSASPGRLEFSQDEFSCRLATVWGESDFWWEENVSIENGNATELASDATQKIDKHGVPYLDDFFSTRGRRRLNMPNQLPDPTSPSVTPPAGAGGAPSVAADH
jgi:hypothetical protein